MLIHHDPIFDAEQLRWIITAGLAVLFGGGLTSSFLLSQTKREYPNGIHIVTILVVIFAATMLALEGVLSGDTTGAILSGIVGYVLASMGRMPDSASKRPRNPQHAAAGPEANETPEREHPASGG